MLDLLIPSRTRRELLRLLYVDGARGTISALARAADLSQAATHTELHTLERAALATRSLDAGPTLFQARPNHPHAKLLRQLLALPDTDAADTSARDAALPVDPQTTRNDLAALGARLEGHRVVTDTTAAREEALARGVVLARHDVEVAQAMPALLAKEFPRIDFEAFATDLLDLRHKHTAGFLLAVAADMTQDKPLRAKLRAAAETLRDGRRTRLVHFFSPRARPVKADDAQTFETARAWGFHYPLPAAGFGGP